MHKLYFALIALLCICLKAGALDFRTMGLDVGLEDVYYNTGSEEALLLVPENHISGSYRLRAGGSPLELYRKAQGEQGEVKVPVAQIAIPDGLTSGILVFLPHNGAGQGWRTVWVDDSEFKANRNSVFFFNFSSRLVGVQIGDKQWPIEPGKTQQARFDASARSLPVQIAAQGANGWERVHTNRMPVRDGFNMFVFLKNGMVTEEGTVDLVDVVRFYEMMAREPSVGAVAVGR